MRLLVSGATKTVARLGAQYPDLLGILLSPNRNKSPSLQPVIRLTLPWGIDNGAYGGFDSLAFRRLVARAAGRPRLWWVACPDVVADARATLRQFDQWEPELRQAGVPVAFVGQDGQEDLEVPWDRLDCLFVGGSTRWKLSLATCELAAEAKRRGKLVHVGRVNTLQRMQWALDIGADSIDGSSASMFPDASIARFCRWRGRMFQQPTFFKGLASAD